MPDERKYLVSRGDSIGPHSNKLPGTFTLEGAHTVGHSYLNGDYSIWTYNEKGEVNIVHRAIILSDRRA